ncbi:hypothetical protein Q2T76_02035 [Lactobacillus sp. YT155]|uniref:MarR family winged helix-turn-helix transcriptional regulator n=1 Tax=Lactobacillus sp. YT155 TaxID=3060955 RepID=UPI00265F51EF|nr:hypothetical protein [Lactobacillus sp. YT155]MDO1604829.1 hypothetical protein [Lactobacillus sp. YT155]
MTTGCNDARSWYLENIKIMNKMNNFTNNYGLGFMQYCMLEMISKSTFETPSHLSEELQMANTSISRAIKKMNSKGLIERLVSEFDDTRRIKITITKHGEQVLQKIDKDLNEEFLKYFNEFV